MPRKQFPSTPTPEWLEKISPDSAFNREDVIDKSIYYPGSYVDGGPLAAYGGFCHSFVYVDYYVTNDEIRSYIPRIAGYEPIFIKDVSKSDLSPNPVHQHHPRASDFYDNQNRLTIDELMADFKPHRRQETNPPFCLWTVLQRKARTNPSHGPSRMSLLYICGDGAATYRCPRIAFSNLRSIDARERPGQPHHLVGRSFWKTNVYPCRRRPRTG